MAAPNKYIEGVRKVALAYPELINLLHMEEEFPEANLDAIIGGE